MIPPHPQCRRRHPRVLVDLPLCLWNGSHHLLDSQAAAHDVTPDGFGFETTADLTHDTIRVYFELRLPDGESVSGAARVVWSQRYDWGVWGGAKIVDFSWLDRRKVRRAIYGPGFDWEALADRALIAGTIILAGLAAQEIITRHGDMLALSPLLALAACAAAVVYFTTR